MPLNFQKNVDSVEGQDLKYLLPLYAEELNSSKTKEKDLNPH